MSFMSLEAPSLARRCIKPNIVMQGKAAPASAAAAASGARAGAVREVEVLPSVDAQGRAVAGSFGREAAGQGALPPGEPYCPPQQWGDVYYRPLGARPPARARCRQVHSDNTRSNHGGWDVEAQCLCLCCCMAASGCWAGPSLPVGQNETAYISGVVLSLRFVCAGRKQKRIQRFGVDGQRERWTADDEANPDLNTLLKRQKHEVRLQDQMQWESSIASETESVPHDRVLRTRVPRWPDSKF